MKNRENHKEESNWSANELTTAAFDICPGRIVRIVECAFPYWMSTGFVRLTCLQFSFIRTHDSTCFSVGDPISFVISLFGHSSLPCCLASWPVMTSSFLLYYIHCGYASCICCWRCMAEYGHFVQYYSRNVLNKTLLMDFFQCAPTLYCSSVDWRMIYFLCLSWPAHSLPILINLLLPPLPAPRFTLFGISHQHQVNHYFYGCQVQFSSLLAAWEEEKSHLSFYCFRLIRFRSWLLNPFTLSRLKHK